MKKYVFLIVSLLSLVGLPACVARGGLTDVSVAPTTISPNADGIDDLARISYKVNTRTKVSIYLQDAIGTRYDIRRDEERAPGATFTYLFNGIAGGRMLANGNYTWHIESATQALTGVLRIENADSTFPKIQELTLDRTQFTPNRDGIDDRIAISAFTSKQGFLDVYVVGADTVRYNVPREEGVRQIYQEVAELPAGRYDYDFDGGIDLGAEPPPDGDYVLYAELSDKIGQRDVMTRNIQIKDSGRPMAEIVIQPNGNGFAWSGIYERPEMTLPLGGTIFFTTTVRNVGAIPIRTAGPFDPNDCYKMNQSRYTKGFEEESGAWRVGVDFEGNRGEDHPWRWGVGDLTVLDIVERDGVKLYYLGRDKQVVVRGCITFDQMPQRNPFTIWGALIQEGVNVYNARVTPILIKIAKP